MRVRFASSADLDCLEGIEDAADRMFLDVFGEVEWPSASTGAWRAAQPGFLLVAGVEVYGFAHVLEVDGEAHLEQLAVEPDSQRRGAGATLVRAALTEVAARGYDSLSLRTYADIPWNAPFYARLGFAVAEPTSTFQLSLVAKEQAMHLMDYGPRVLMRARSGPIHSGGSGSIGRIDATTPQSQP
jgi:GNAT superfamily N-acetyltransferase